MRYTLEIYFPAPPTPLALRLRPCLPVQLHLPKFRSRSTWSSGVQLGVLYEAQVLRLDAQFLLGGVHLDRVPAALTVEGAEQRDLLASKIWARSQAGEPRFLAFAVDEHGDCEDRAGQERCERSEV